MASEAKFKKIPNYLQIVQGYITQTKITNEYHTLVCPRAIDLPFEILIFEQHTSRQPTINSSKQKNTKCLFFLMKFRKFRMSQNDYVIFKLFGKNSLFYLKKWIFFRCLCHMLEFGDFPVHFDGSTNKEYRKFFQQSYLMQTNIYMNDQWIICLKRIFKMILKAIVQGKTNIWFTVTFSLKVYKWIY